MLIALTLASVITSADPIERHPSALTVLAEIALERGDCKGAAESYAAAAPNGSVALAKRASEVALACEHLPAAWESVQRWRQLAPADLNAAAVYASIALKLYRIPEAQAAMQTVVQSTESPTQLAELTSLLLDEAEPHAVLAALSSVIPADTAAPLTLTMLAELAFNAHDLRRAEQYVAGALKQQPALFEARSLMAQIHARRGNDEDALASARTAMQADPQRGKFELATTLIALDRPDEAREELERLRADGAPAEEVDRRLALLSYESGDLEDARRRLSALAAQAETTNPAESAAQAGSTGSAEAALLYLSQ